MRSGRIAGLSLCLLGLAGSLWTTWSALATPRLVMSSAYVFDLICWLCLAGVAALFGTAFRRSALWATLSFVTYAATLQLVDAGTSVVYPHLRPAVTPLTTDDWMLLGALTAATSLVVAGLIARARPLRAWISEHVGPARTLLVLGIWAAVSASPLRDLGALAGEVALSTLTALAGLGALVLAAMDLPTGSARALSGRLERWRGPAGGRRRIDPVAASAAAFTTLVSAALAFWVWERHPHLSDEVSFLFQAKYFAQGRLAAPGVPLAELFDAYQIQCGLDRCISVLQPGWPGLLAGGVLIGAPWLVNPLLAGINVLLFHVLMRELYGASLARLAVMLFAISPWNLFLAMSLMNHQATLLGGLVAGIGATLLVRRGRAAWALLAGAGAGFTSLMRPMDGVIVLVVAGLATVARGSVRRRLGAATLFGIGTLALGSVNLAYNRALTGAPLDFPVTDYVNELWGEGTNNLGFGPDRGVYPMWSQMDGFPGHSPFQAAVNAELNLTALQLDLFGWAVGSLLPLILLLAWGRLRASDWLMIGVVGVVNAMYALYWFASGPDFAARYWFLALVPLVALTARGLQELAERVERGAPARGRAAVALAVLLLVGQSLLVFVPWRSTDKYYGYFNTGPDVREALEAGRWPPGVYLVRGASQPDYAAAMIYTSPDLAGGDVVFAYDSLPDSEALLRRSFPGRDLWLLDGPSRTGSGYALSRAPER